MVTHTHVACTSISLYPSHATLQASAIKEECNKSIDKMGVEIHRLEQVRCTHRD